MRAVVFFHFILNLNFFNFLKKNVFGLSYEFISIIFLVSKYIFEPCLGLLSNEPFNNDSFSYLLSSNSISVELSGQLKNLELTCGTCNRLFASLSARRRHEKSKLV